LPSAGDQNCQKPGSLWEGLSRYVSAASHTDAGASGLMLVREGRGVAEGLIDGEGSVHIGDPMTACWKATADPSRFRRTTRHPICKPSMLTSKA
jgi:hypothetical protein